MQNPSKNIIGDYTLQPVSLTYLTYLHTQSHIHDFLQQIFIQKVLISPLSNNNNKNNSNTTYKNYNLKSEKLSSFLSGCTRNYKNLKLFTIEIFIYTTSYKI
ncbi:hypothetical protein ABPG74_014948 [Tetrahymena malaccensis]